MREFKHCPTCGNDLEKTGITTTRHDVYQCATCQIEWVAWYDELKPVIEYLSVDFQSYQTLQERRGPGTFTTPSNGKELHG